MKNYFFPENQLKKNKKMPFFAGPNAPLQDKPRQWL